jgi:hypothetical protein
MRVPTTTPGGAPLPLAFRLWHPGAGGGPQLYGSFTTAEAQPSERTWVSIEHEYDDDPMYANIMAGYTLTIAGYAAAHPTMTGLWKQHASRELYTGPTLGIEVLSPTVTAHEGDAPRWAYGRFPSVYAYQCTLWESPYGEQLPALEFRHQRGNTAWGDGPRPVHTDANGDLVRYPEARAGHLFTLATTTVNPQTALTYTAEKDTTS